MDPQQQTQAIPAPGGAGTAPQAATPPPVGGGPLADPSFFNPTNTGTIAPQGKPQNPPAPAAGTPPANAQQQAAAIQSLREAANKLYGLDLSSLPDDNAALQYLVTQAVQGQQYASMANRYLPHAEAIEQFLASRQAAQQQPESPRKPWQNPVEWRPEWNQLIKLDPTTGLAAPGSDPVLAQKWNAYVQHRSQWANQLLDNTEGAIGQLIEERAAKLIEQKIAEHLGGYQEKVWADNFVQSNSAWLHERDPQGNVVMVTNPQTGLAERKLSPVGARFRDYVILAQRSGVQNLELQQQFARSMVERDLLSAQQQLQQAQARGEQNKQQTIQQHNRQPDFSGTLPPVNPNPNAHMPQNPTLSFRDMMRADFQRLGIKDGDFLTQSPAAAAN